MRLTTQGRWAWLVCVLLLVAVLWPNLAGVRLAPDLVCGWAAPMVCARGAMDALVDATPLSAVILIELVLLTVLARPWLWLALHLPFLLWLPVELYYQHRYAQPTSAHILAILHESNWDEARGYLGAALWGVMALWALWALSLLALLCWFYRTAPPWQHRTRWWTLSVLVPVALFTLGSYKYYSDEINASDSKLGLSAQGVIAAGEGDGRAWLWVFSRSYPFGLPLRIADYYAQERALAQYGAALRGTPFALPRAGLGGELSNIPETYVVVIGESARADHWQINGYERATTPKLAQRAGLVSFTDAVSVTAATRTSVPVLLSGMSVRDVWTSQFKPSWIQALQSAGFEVTWLSTQMPVGSHDTTISIYAQLADAQAFLNFGNYKGAGQYDDALVDALRARLTTPDSARQQPRKRVFVLHGLGSHAPYRHRYPAAFAQFVPDHLDALPREERAAQKAQVTTNAYDNTLVFTDTVLDAVMTQLNQQPGITALWYVSDHGQTLPSDGCDNTGNGFYARQNFHVPLLFWRNAAFDAALGARTQDLASHADQPIYAGDFFATLLDSLGFDVEGQPGSSFARAQYRAPQRLVTVAGEDFVDYDTAFEGGVCLEKP